MIHNHKLLVLDLDETLIHSSYSPISGEEFKAKKGLFYLYERPHLKRFLDSCLTEYNLAIWSASKSIYVAWIIKSTVLKEYEFEFIKTRKDCKRIYGKSGFLVYQKDLTPQLPKYRKVIMLDDLPKGVSPTGLVIKIAEFKGCGSDIELLKVNIFE
jgi:RNA polymerase II subunit A small phosphatase-like protein